MSSPASLTAKQLEKLNELERYKQELSSAMEDLDAKLGKTITRQESEYLLTYSKFVT
jgi:hypothetical protein